MSILMIIFMRSITVSQSSVGGLSRPRMGGEHSMVSSIYFYKSWIGIMVEPFWNWSIEGVLDVIVLDIYP